MTKKIVVRFLCVLLSLSALLLIPAEAKLVPYYSVSSAYKKSEYYKNLTSITLTGDNRYDVLAIAFSQLGYHEGDSLAELDGTNLIGSGAFSEYAKEFGYGNAAWCALFVSWCMRQARVDAKVAPNYAGCTAYVKWLKKNSTYYEASTGYIPIPGDLIFFKDEWETEDCSTHIGFVVGFDKNYVYTIEGNGNKSVIQRRYDVDNPYIIGYGVPAYKTKAGTVYNFPLNYTLSAKGEYLIPSDGIVLYKSPEASSDLFVFEDYKEEEKDKGGETSSGAVESGAIESGAIESGAVESGAVESGAIESGAIESGAVESGAVESGAVKSGAVKSGALESKSVAGSSIISGSILLGGQTVCTGFTTHGYGRIYITSDGIISQAVIDPEVTTHTDYKETQVGSAAWFRLEDAIYLDEDVTEVTVSFDANGGVLSSVATSVTVPVGTTVVIPSAGIPTRDHATFIGWGVTKADTVVRFVEGETYVANNDLKLYAIWKMDTVTVSFMDEDGKTLLATSKVDYGSAVVAPITPTKSSDGKYAYTFTGWSPKLSSSVTKDTVYKAVFKATELSVVTTEEETTQEETTEPVTTEAVTTEEVTTEAVTTAEVTTAPETTAVPTEPEVTTSVPEETTSVPEETTSPETTPVSEPEKTNFTVEIIIVLAVIILAGIGIALYCKKLNKRGKKE